MRVVVMPEPGQVELHDVPRPHVRAGHVLIETHYSSISAGTELLVLAGRLPGVHGGVVRYPLVPGYENVGKVLEVGEGAFGLSPGDWVISEGSVSFPGLNSCWGGHSELVLADGERVFRLPRGLPPERGLFVILTAIALHALQRGALSLGDEVAIFGQGVVGLLALQLARALGVSHVVAIDRLEARLEVARELGASEVVLADSVDEVRARLADLSNGGGFDLVVEATGSAEVAGLAPNICREQSRLVLAGMYTQPITFDYWPLYAREITVLPSRQAGPKEELPDAYYRWTWRRTVEQSLELLEREEILVDPLLTHRLPVERIAEGYDALSARPQETLKVVLEWC